MAAGKKKKSAQYKKKSSPKAGKQAELRCSQPEAPERSFTADVNNDRQSLVRLMGKK